MGTMTHQLNILREGGKRRREGKVEGGGGRGGRVTRFAPLTSLEEFPPHDCPNTGI
jgi:hypothetical protein